MADLPVRARLETELVLLLFLTVVTFSVSAIVDPDLPGHIAYGLAHYDSGEIPLTDPYSYTVASDDRWVNHEWVFELTVGLLFRHLGPSALVALQAVVWGLTGGLVLFLLRRSSKVFVPGAILYLLFCSAAFASITIRPQLFTYLCFAVLLLILELARGGRTWTLAALPILFGLWVNLHGGFLAGLCVLGAYTAGLAVDAAIRRCDVSRRLAAAAVGATLLAVGATFLNPYGAHLWGFLLDSLSRSRAAQITEWRSLGLDAQGILFGVLVVLAVAAVFARAKSDPERVPLAHVFVLLGTVVLAVRHARHAPFFAMAACAFLPGALGELYNRFVPPHDEDLPPERLGRFRLVYAALLLPALVLNLSWPDRDTLTLRLRPSGNSQFPTGALLYMDAREVRGNMLVHFDWAQLVIWRYHPEVHVFYDGRFRTVYRQEIEDAFFDFMNPDTQSNWKRALDDYPTEWILLPVACDATDRVLKLEEWRLVYQDTQAMLFRRRGVADPSAGTVVGPHPPPTIPFR